MIAWSKFSFHVPTSYSQVCKQVLWLNSNIKERNKVIVFEGWISVGLTRFEQLLINNRLKTCQELITEFGNKINIIDYYRLIKSIPKVWFKIVQSKIETGIHPSGLEKLKNTVKCGKMVYEDLRDKRSIKAKLKTQRPKWELELSTEITDKRWSEVYRKTMRLTLCTKLRFFQYRLLNGYLLTNDRVSKWDKEVTPYCQFCGNDNIETPYHIFVRCTVVKRFWECLKRWLYHFCFLPVEFNDREIILNEYKDSFPDLVNTLILIAKYYIYAQKCLKKPINFHQYIGRVVKFKKIEFEVAKKRKQIVKNRV